MDLAAGPPMKDRNRKVEPQVTSRDADIYTNEPKWSTSISRSYGMSYALRIQHKSTQ